MQTMPVATQPGRRTSSAAWLEGVLSMFDAQGLDVPSLLLDAGFDPDAVHHRDARFGVDDISVLWQRAVARAACPTLGLSRPLAATYGKVGAVGHSMASSADLRSALARLKRYMAVISDATTFTLETDPRGCWVGTSHAGGSLPIPRQRVEFALLTTFAQCQWITRRELVPLAVEFAYAAPADRRLHEDAFGCEVRFGAATNRLLLANADLASPLPTADATLSALHERMLDDQLEMLGQHSISARVCAEIARCLPQGEPRRPDVAVALGIAERTLQRRLQDEAVSFQTLLERTRQELARQYLADARYSLVEVADLLGFVDTSNFFRACKRWFGLPPAQYRAKVWQANA